MESEDLTTAAKDALDVAEKKGSLMTSGSSCHEYSNRMPSMPLLACRECTALTEVKFNLCHLMLADEPQNPCVRACKCPQSRLTNMWRISVSLGKRHQHWEIVLIGVTARMHANETKCRT